MSLVITQGYGDPGFAISGQTVVTQGYGSGVVTPTCHAFDLLALNVFQNRLDLVFTTPIVLLSPFAANPANWSINSLGTGVNMNVLTVSVSGATVSLGVTEGTSG